MNYYNEFDPKAAAWLRELIKQGHIPPGDVDTRSITQVSPHDLSRYTQCHFFAGIGGWSYALELAGWPADRAVWTGSCPCQPFSAAGKGLGNADERHLWPAFFSLIRECRPVAVFGEQVASAIGHGWLDGVCADLEGEGYACGAAVLGAHSVSAPHIRQRLYWMADATGGQREQCIRSQGDGLQRPTDHGAASGLAAAQHTERRAVHVTGQDGRDRQDAGRQEAHGELGARGEVCGLAHSESGGLGINGSSPGHAGHADECEQDGRMGEPILARLQGHAGHVHDRDQPGRLDPHAAGSTATPSRPWDSYELLPCTDGKARRIEPGTFPLAHGVSGRVGLLRGYGNAIVPQVAAEFVSAYLE